MGQLGFVGTVHVVPPPRRVLSLIAAVAVALGLCVACTTKATGHGQGPAAHAQPSATRSSSSAGTGATTPAPKPSTIDFSDCSGLFNLSAAGIPADRRSKLTFDCGRQYVPVDYAQPNGPTISIEVIRVHYRDQPARIGSLLVNPGGPGGSGVFLAISLAASLSDDVLQHFDIVGFYLRGVGLSSPIKCETDPAETQALALDPDVRTASGLEQAKRQAQTFAASCDRKYGAALAHYNTVETARDMDQIRAAVGDEQMNYLGFSYGTELGAVYAHLFPTKIRVAVLDGAVDPLTDRQRDRIQRAADRRLRERVRPVRGRLRQTPRVQAARQRAQGGRRTREEGQHGADSELGRRRDPQSHRRRNVLYAVLSALYSEQLWPDLGTALIDVSTATPAPPPPTTKAQRDQDGHYSNPLDLFQSAELQRPEASHLSDAAIKAAATRWATQFPLFGVWSAASMFQCQAWQKERHPIPPETATGSKPILVVGNLHDPATPYAGAVHLAAKLGTGVLLTWDGQGHTSYGQSRLHRPEGQCIPDQRDRADREHHLPALNGARREPAAA